MRRSGDSGYPRWLQRGIIAGGELPCRNMDRLLSDGYIVCLGCVPTTLVLWPHSCDQSTLSELGDIIPSGHTPNLACNGCPSAQVRIFAGDINKALLITTASLTKFLSTMPCHHPIPKFNNHVMWMSRQTIMRSGYKPSSCNNLTKPQKRGRPIFLPFSLSRQSPPGKPENTFPGPRAPAM